LSQCLQSNAVFFLSLIVIEMVCQSFTWWGAPQQKSRYQDCSWPWSYQWCECFCHSHWL